jgi:hypothetical protein
MSIASYHSGFRAINVLASEENNLTVGTQTFIHLLENCQSRMTKKLKYHLKDTFLSVKKAANKINNISFFA